MTWQDLEDDVAELFGELGGAFDFREAIRNGVASTYYATEAFIGTEVCACGVRVVRTLRSFHRGPFRGCRRCRARETVRVALAALQGRRRVCPCGAAIQGVSPRCAACRRERRRAYEVERKRRRELFGIRGQPLSDAG